MDFLWMFLGLFFSPFKTAVTGHTWDQQVPITFFCDGKIPSSQVNGQFFIRTMGRTRSATSPIIQLVKLDIKEVRYTSN
jgi:hypothetical protein